MEEKSAVFLVIQIVVLANEAPLVLLIRPPGENRFHVVRWPAGRRTGRNRHGSRSAMIRRPKERIADRTTRRPTRENPEGSRNPPRFVYLGPSYSPTPDRQQAHCNLRKKSRQKQA
jgi:hypothetical protein